MLGRVMVDSVTSFRQHDRPPLLLPPQVNVSVTELKPSAGKVEGYPQSRPGLADSEQTKTDDEPVRLISNVTPI